MNYLHYVGIDISKETLDVYVLKGKIEVFYLQISNNVKGMRQLFKSLNEVDCFNLRTTLFCMENTGIYNTCVLYFLHEQAANICLENAVQIKQSIGLQRGKNDKVDAMRIAWYAYKNAEELRLWHPQRDVIKRLKNFSGLRNRLINAKKQLAVPLNELKYMDKQNAKEIDRYSRKTLETLRKNIEEVDQKMLAVIKEDEYLNKVFHLITSIPGIGNVVATEVIVSTNEFKNINDSRKYACYSGIAPFEHRSGSSIRGKTRVSHRANKRIKTLLHLAVLSSLRCNTDIRHYYERKVKEGKHKMSVINAVKNKMINRIFAVVKNQKMYVNNLTEKMLVLS